MAQLSHRENQANIHGTTFSQGESSQHSWHNFLTGRIKPTKRSVCVDLDYDRERSSGLVVLRALTKDITVGAYTGALTRLITVGAYTRALTRLITVPSHQLSFTTYTPQSKTRQQQVQLTSTEQWHKHNLEMNFTKYN